MEEKGNEKEKVIEKENEKGQDEAEEKTVRELMEEMKEQYRKNLIYQRVNAVLLLVFVIISLVVAPSLIKTLTLARTTLDNVNCTVSHANEAVTKMEDTIGSIQTLVENSGKGMEQAIEKMNAFDIETLNDAIYDLSEVVEPLARFFGKFK